MDHALLIGIDNYKHLDPLHGCLNDVAAMRAFLEDRCHFAPDKIRTLAETDATKDKIVEALATLVDKVTPRDRVVFHFSGHGTQLPSFEAPRELDGVDEVICPFDFDPAWRNGIRDRHLREILSGVPADVRFVWIADSCSSGDLALLDYLLHQHRQLPVRKVTVAGRRTVTLPPDIAAIVELARKNGARPLGFKGAANELNVVLLSACAANGTALEIRRGDITQGFFTASLLDRLARADGCSTPLTAIIDDVEEAMSSLLQIPEISGTDANKRATFPCTASDPSLSRPTSAPTQKKSFCAADYVATRVSSELTLVTATGSHPGTGYTQKFVPTTSTDTYEFIHVPQAPLWDENKPFTEFLDLTNFTSESVRIRDLFGVVEVKIPPVGQSATSEPRPQLAAQARSRMFLKRGRPRDARGGISNALQPNFTNE